MNRDTTAATHGMRTLGTTERTTRRTTTTILPLLLPYHTLNLAAPPCPLYLPPGALTIAVRPSSRAADIIAAFYFIAQPTG